MRTFILASTIALLGLSSTAHAHFILMSPPPTNPADTTQGKGGLPCGPDMAMATTPTAAQGGHTILLKLNETVPHSGFYRVALSINSRTEIPPDNVVHDGTGKVLPSSGIGPDGKPLIGTSASAVPESPAVFPVLADNLFMHQAAGMQTFMTNIMLPNVNCDHCTMQVIEFMFPHGYNGTPGKNDGGGYFYHHCADLKITADPAMPLFVPGGTDGGASDAMPTTDASGAGGTTGSSGASGSTAGSNGTGGTTTGAGGSAGTTATGTAGSGGSPTGAAGASMAGAAGAGGTTATTGSAGTAGTPQRSSGGGGCSIGGTTLPKGLASLLGLTALAGLIARRRRSKSGPA